MSSYLLQPHWICESHQATPPLAEENVVALNQELMPAGQVFLARPASSCVTLAWGGQDAR